MCEQGMSGVKANSQRARTALTDGSASSQNKGESREQPTSKVPLSTPRYQDKNDGTEEETEPCTNFVLGTQEGFGTLVNGGVNFVKTASRGLVVRTVHEAGRVRYALGTDGNACDDEELDESP